MAVSVSSNTPYSTVSNAYSSMVNGDTGPIQYNTGYGNLRSSSPSVFINTQPNNRQDRIQQQIDKALEKQQTQRGVQRALNQDWQSDYINRLSTAPLMPGTQARTIQDNLAGGASYATSTKNSLSGFQNLSPLMQQAQAQEQYKNSLSAYNMGFDVNQIQKAYNDFLQKSASFGGGNNPVNAAWARYRG